MMENIIFIISQETLNSQRLKEAFSKCRISQRIYGIIKKLVIGVENGNQLAKLFHILWFPIDEKLLEKI